MGPEYAFLGAAICAVVLVALVVGALALARSDAREQEARAGAAELAVVQDELDDTRAELAEWKRRYEEAERDAEEAARRGRAAVERARQAGADLADPDDDAAFARVLQRQAERERRRPAAGAAPPAGEPAPPPDDGGAGALEA